MTERVNYGVRKFIRENKIENQWIGRIIKQTNNTFTVATENAILEHVQKKLSKKEKKKQSKKSSFVVGDFVILETLEEHVMLIDYFERRNVLSKAQSQAKKSWKKQAEEQMVAANIDHLFITIATDQRFTLSKLERYLLTFGQVNMKQTILITKADYKEQAEYLTKEIRAAYPDLHVEKVSATEKIGVEKVKSLLEPDTTAILLGASGAGKSTLNNSLLGEEREQTNFVRKDGKGKHTTTYSTLVRIPDTESLIVDTPGIKSIATTKKNNQSNLFEDIEELAIYCKYRNCKHQSEPKCAVKKAVREGRLDKQRLERFIKLS